MLGLTALLLTLALDKHGHSIAVRAYVGTAAEADACDRYRHVGHGHTTYHRETNVGRAHIKSR